MNGSSRRHTENDVTLANFVPIKIYHWNENTNTHRNCQTVKNQNKIFNSECRTNYCPENSGCLDLMTNQHSFLGHSSFFIQWFQICQKFCYNISFQLNSFAEIKANLCNQAKYDRIWKIRSFPYWNFAWQEKLTT